MKEAFGNIWQHQDEYDAVVITTNGFVKKNGEAVMGRGIALEAVEAYPEFPARLGSILKQYGNIVWLFNFDQWSSSREADYEDLIFTFPVKPEYGPNGEMGWKVKADLKLIIRSAKQLVKFVDEFSMKKILMPRPGCGNGGLKWEDVKPVIEPYLDDRFTVMTNDPRIL